MIEFLKYLFGGCCFKPIKEPELEVNLAQDKNSFLTSNNSSIHNSDISNFVINKDYLDYELHLSRCHITLKNYLSDMSDSFINSDQFIFDAFVDPDGDFVKMFIGGSRICATFAKCFVKMLRAYDNAGLRGFDHTFVLI